MVADASAQFTPPEVCVLLRQSDFEWVKRCATFQEVLDNLPQVENDSGKSSTKDSSRIILPGTVLMRSPTLEQMQHEMTEFNKLRNDISGKRLSDLTSDMIEKAGDAFDVCKDTQTRVNDGDLGIRLGDVLIDSGLQLNSAGLAVDLRFKNVTGTEIPGGSRIFLDCIIGRCFRDGNRFTDLDDQSDNRSTNLQEMLTQNLRVLGDDCINEIVRLLIDIRTFQLCSTKSPIIWQTDPTAECAGDVLGQFEISNKRVAITGYFRDSYPYERIYENGLSLPRYLQLKFVVNAEEQLSKNEEEILNSILSEVRLAFESLGLKVEISLSTGEVEVWWEMIARKPDEVRTNGNECVFLKEKLLELVTTAIPNQYALMCLLAQEDCRFLVDAGPTLSYVCQTAEEMNEFSCETALNYRESNLRFLRTILSQEYIDHHGLQCLQDLQNRTMVELEQQTEINPLVVHITIVPQQ